MISSSADEFRVGSSGLKIDDSLADANYVEIATSPVFSTSDSITVSGWYRLEDIAGDGMDTRNFIWETVGSYSLSYGVRSDTSDGEKRGQWFTQSPSISNDSNSGPLVDDSQWHHSAVVIDQSAGEVSFYHDGQLFDSAMLPSGYGMNPSSSGFSIGNHRSGDGSRNWDGFIDDVAIHHGALSAANIQSLYDGSATPSSVVGGAVTEVPEPIPPAPSVPGSWTMAIIPDTQNYTTLNNGIFSTITNWLADEGNDISLALHVGDITNRNDTTEWGRAKPAIANMDGNVPYILATGNHDYGPGGGAGNRQTLFNDYFDESLYESDEGLIFPDLRIAEQFEDISRFGTDSEEPEANRTLENVAYQFAAPDGRKMLVFSLEWGVRQEVVDWANAVASDERYADHTAVLLTHAYLYSDSTRYDWTNQNTSNDEPGNTHSGSGQGANPHVYGTADTDDSAPANDTNDGEELWRELVGVNDNFEMTFNGHVIIGGQLGYLESTGSAGQSVHQMLFNAQADANGGDGWIRLLEFLPDGQTVQVKTYSPHLDQWRTDPANQFQFTLSTVASGNHIEGIADIFLLVDPETGTAQLRNQSGIDVAFEGYMLQSDSGSLLPNEWQSLDDLDGPGSEDGGWRESNPSTIQLAELLQSGDYLLADEQIIRLGSIFDTDGGNRDLTIQLLLQRDSEPTTLRVIYETLPESPDFNGDGFVNLADYTVWRNMLGSTGIGQTADGNGDGIVDAADYQVWKYHFSVSSGGMLTANSVDQVPEPATATVGAILTAVIGLFPRWRT